MKSIYNLNIVLFTIILLVSMAINSMCILPFGPGFRNGMSSATKSYSDSVIVGYQSPGNYKATIDNQGRVATSEYFYGSGYLLNYSLEWMINPSRFSIVYSDSVISAAVAADTSGTWSDVYQYFSFTTASSPSMKKIIILQTIYPVTLRPDSLILRVWFNGTASNTDSGYVIAVLKDEIGVIASTGKTTVTSASTWQRIAFPFSDEFDRNKSYSLQVYAGAVSGKRWCIGNISIK